MGRQAVKSREYKVMLQATPFAGADDAVRATIGRFWSDVAAALTNRTTNVGGEFGLIKHRRTIRFYDTADHHLHQHSYIFRERVDVDTTAREVTLKYRHADRYAAADRDMDVSGRDAESKFEEDVKPPFTSVFSYSTTAPLGAEDRYESLAHIRDLYPGLARSLELPWEEPLHLVRGFSARETVFVGAEVLLGADQVAAPCALVVWHDDDDPSTPPVAVEFSFKYGNHEEEYDGSLALAAFDFLRFLHNELPAWVNPKGQTKTGLVYSATAPAESPLPPPPAPPPAAPTANAAKAKAASDRKAKDRKQGKGKKR